MENQPLEVSFYSKGVPDFNPDMVIEQFKSELVDIDASLKLSFPGMPTENLSRNTEEILEAIEQLDPFSRVMVAYVLTNSIEGKSREEFVHSSEKIKNPLKEFFISEAYAEGVTFPYANEKWSTRNHINDNCNLSMFKNLKWRSHTFLKMLTGEIDASLEMQLVLKLVYDNVDLTKSTVGIIMDAVKGGVTPQHLIMSEIQSFLAKEILKLLDRRLEDKKFASLVSSNDSSIKNCLKYIFIPTQGRKTDLEIIPKDNFDLNDASLNVPFSFGLKYSGRSLTLGDLNSFQNFQETNDTSLDTLEGNVGVIVSSLATVIDVMGQVSLQSRTSGDVVRELLKSEEPFDHYVPVHYVGDVESIDIAKLENVNFLDRVGDNRSRLEISSSALGSDGNYIAEISKINTENNTFRSSVSFEYLNLNFPWGKSKGWLRPDIYFNRGDIKIKAINNKAITGVGYYLDDGSSGALAEFEISNETDKGSNLFGHDVFVQISHFDVGSGSVVMDKEYSFPDYDGLIQFSHTFLEASYYVIKLFFVDSNQVNAPVKVSGDTSVQVIKTPKLKIVKADAPRPIQGSISNPPDAVVLTVTAEESSNLTQLLTWSSGVLRDDGTVEDIQINRGTVLRNSKYRDYLYKIGTIRFFLHYKDELGKTYETSMDFSGADYFSIDVWCNYTDIGTIGSYDIKLNGMFKNSLIDQDLEDKVITYSLKGETCDVNNLKTRDPNEFVGWKYCRSSTDIFVTATDAWGTTQTARCNRSF